MAIQQVKVTACVTHSMCNAHFRNSSEILSAAESMQVSARNHFNRVQRWVKCLPDSGRLSPDLLLSDRANNAHASFAALHDIIEAAALLKHVLERDYPKDIERADALAALLKSYRLKLRKCRMALHAVSSRCIPLQLMQHIDDVQVLVAERGLPCELLILASPYSNGLDFYSYLSLTLPSKRKRYLLVSVHQGVPYVNILSRYTPPNRLVKGLATNFNQLMNLCNDMLKEELP